MRKLLAFLLLTTQYTSCMGNEIWYIDKISYLECDGKSKLYPVATLHGNSLTLFSTDNTTLDATNNYELSDSAIIVYLNGIKLIYKPLKLQPIKVDLETPTITVKTESNEWTMTLNYLVNKWHSQYKLQGNEIFIEIYNLSNISILFCFEPSFERLTFGFLTEADESLHYKSVWGSTY